MTPIGTHVAAGLAAGAAALLAAGTVAAGVVFGAEASAGDGGRQPAALVIDASLARDGRELVDPRLKDVDAQVRLPRDAGEARTNVRYFDSLGYRVYVAGATAAAAAERTGVPATEVDGLAGALNAAR
jgi:hypothetical protein